VRWGTTAAGVRPGRPRAAGTAVPRRAHHRPGPRIPPSHVGSRAGTAPRRHHGPADHALPGRSGKPGAPVGDHARRTDRRFRNAERRAAQRTGQDLLHRGRRTAAAAAERDGVGVRSAGDGAHRATAAGLGAAAGVGPGEPGAAAPAESPPRLAGRRLPFRQATGGHPMTSAVLALSRAEWKLLMRNKTIALCCTAFPVGFGAYYAFALPDGSSPQLWALIISLQLMTVFGFTIYFTATATLTSRREDRYLKRLRSGEMTAPTVLTGLLLPVVLLGVAQAAALLAIAFWLGAPLPSDPLPLLAAMLAGSALCVAAGAVTSVFT